MSDDLLHSLNPAQREAVLHRDGPLLILAGPGSGKTRVITHRIANLLRHGVPARQVLALTFTNKAADEMRSRVERLAPGQPVWTSTFHRYCARLLRQYGQHVGLQENYTIYDAGDSRQALSRTLDALSIDSAHFTPDRIAAAIGWAKNNLIAAADYEPKAGRPLGQVVAKVYPAYQKRLLTANAVDFDDLLLHTATLLRENPHLRATLDARFQYIMVDEYQDTNLAQYAIVRALSIDHPNLAVTGDPDQSIYGWRGANLSNILDFEKDFHDVCVIKLERNYRSTKAILRVADTLIAHNVRRKKKGLFTENAEGAPVRLIQYTDQLAEAESIAARIAADIRAGRRQPREFAIFYRVNALSRAIEFALREQGVPYQMVRGVEFYQRKEIKDVLAYLHLLNNPRDDVALLRIVNTPPRGIGRTTLDRIGRFAAERGMSLWEASRQAGMVDGLNQRAAVAVARFVHLIDRLSAVSHGSVEEVLGRVLTESGYQQVLRESDDDDDQERLANIEELLTAARQFDERHPDDGGLAAFLEESALVNDVDDWEAESNRVTLMTLHAAKGLEFNVVFMVAVEEGLLPHERSRDNFEQLEEERRLAFVGITRGREELELSLARYREYRGQRRYTVPSKFLFEMPQHEMQVVMPNRPQYGVEMDESSACDSAEFDQSEWRDDDLDFPPVVAAPADDSAADELSTPAGNPRADAASGNAFRTSAGRAEAASARQPLTTAAELHAAAATAPIRQRAAKTASPADAGGVSPETFCQGMVVRHPDYGLGKIVALSGSGARRSATVAFASGAGERKFILAASPLRPARPDGQRAN